MRVSIIILTIIGALALGCKTKKGVTAVPESPYTDTLRIPVMYSNDSVDVFVQKIIVNDSLFALSESFNFSIFNTEQKDSILFITLSGYQGCKQAKFVVYQSSIVFKTGPPRINVRIATGEMSGCEEKPAMYTVAVDIRSILKNNSDANLVFVGQSKHAYIKQYK